MASGAATTHLHSSPRPAKNGGTTASNIDGSYDTGLMMTPFGLNALTPIKEQPNKRRKMSNDESDDISSAAPFTSSIHSPALHKSNEKTETPIQMLSPPKKTKLFELPQEKEQTVILHDDEFSFNDPNNANPSLPASQSSLIHQVAQKVTIKQDTKENKYDSPKSKPTRAFEFAEIEKQ